MIVAIPTEMDSLNSKISERFARTAYFLIYNTNDDSYEFISHEMQQEHGAGTKIVNELSVRNVEAVISKKYRSKRSTSFKSWKHKSLYSIGWKCKRKY